MFHWDNGGLMGSVVSYAVGALGLLISLSEDIQAITLLLSLGVLALRLVYDGIRLWRYIRRK
jgi:hypothetical protein